VTATDREKRLLWAGVVGAAVLAVFGGILSAVAVSDVAHVKSISTGLDVADNVLLGAAGLVLALLSGWCGVRCEHLLRHRYSGHRQPTTALGQLPAWRQRHHGPASTTLDLCIYVGFIALLVPGVVSGYHDSEHSRDTQQSGAPRGGRIEKIVYIDQFRVSTGIRYPNYWYSTSESFVVLGSPVLGHRSTTLHYPSSLENPGNSFAVGTNRVGVGRAVDVLVDPKDPAYSEFPGFPVVGNSAWIVPLLFVLVACAPLVFLSRSLARQLRHRRGHGR
jgi:hypothetical protein